MFYKSYQQHPWQLLQQVRTVAISPRFISNTILTNMTTAVEDVIHRVGKIIPTKCMEMLVCQLVGVIDTPPYIIVEKNCCTDKFISKSVGITFFVQIRFIWVFSIQLMEFERELEDIAVQDLGKTISSA